jgi:4-diphosphocytidyl-2C-methyl-D-erythritol kinase
MNKFFLISLLSFIFLQVSGSRNYHSRENSFLQINTKDTIDIEDVAKEDQLIDEVVKSRAIPKKEKVQYFNQVTRYGFKNLFSNYSYNSTLPYRII